MHEWRTNEGPMLTALLADIRERDFVSPQRMSRRLRLPLADLAKLAHVHRNTLTQWPDSSLVQKSLEPLVRILAAAEQLTGDPDRAIIWFRHQPMAGYDGRTALERHEELDLLAVDKCRPRSSGISHALRIICRAKPTGAAPKSPATLPAAATRRAEEPVAGHQRPAFAISPPRPPELVHRLLHLLGLLAGGVEVVLQALDAAAQRVSSDALPVSALLCPVRPAPLGHHCLFQQVGTLTLTVRPSLGHRRSTSATSARFSARSARCSACSTRRSARFARSSAAARSSVSRAIAPFCAGEPSVARSGDCSAERARLHGRILRHLHQCPAIIARLRPPTEPMCAHPDCVCRQAESCTGLCISQPPAWHDQGVVRATFARTCGRTFGVSMVASCVRPWRLHDAIASLQAENRAERSIHPPPARATARPRGVRAVDHGAGHIANGDDRQEGGGVPDLAPLRARFAPIAARLPVVAVNLPSIASYDVLVPTMVATACATTGAVA